MHWTLGHLLFAAVVLVALGAAGIDLVSDLVDDLRNALEVNR